VIDSADRRRMEETGVELQQLLDEVRTYLLLTLIVDVRSQLNIRTVFPLLFQYKLSEQHTVNESSFVKFVLRKCKNLVFICDRNNTRQ
jgi:hypothetical protein